MRCSFADVIAKKIIQVNLMEKTPKNISIPETEMKIVIFFKKISLKLVSRKKSRHCTALLGNQYLQNKFPLPFSIHK